MMAPVKKHIDWKQVEFAMMCSENQEEIAASQGVSVDTLQNRFKEVYDEPYSAFSARLHKKGDVLLREAQVKSALKGSSTMQLWLGKVRLGQVEPDGSDKTAPNQTTVDKDHENLTLKYALAERDKKLEEATRRAEEAFAKLKAYEESMGIRASE